MNLAAYLKKHGLSQEAFAQKVGVSQGMVWQWLRWYENPRDPNATRVTAERALELESKTGGEIRRHDLRPDLFEKPKSAAQIAA